MYSLAAIASQNAEENDFNGTRTKIDETFTMLYPVNGVTTLIERNKGEVSSRQSGDFWIFSVFLDVFLPPRFIHVRIESPHLSGLI